MNKSKRNVLSILFIATFVSLGLYTPRDAQSQTTICPNSAIKCNVTFNHPQYGKVTVESEKGKNDAAIEMPEIEVEGN